VLTRSFTLSSFSIFDRDQFVLKYDSVETRMPVNAADKSPRATRDELKIAASVAFLYTPDSCRSWRLSGRLRESFIFHASLIHAATFLQSALLREKQAPRKFPIDMQRSISRDSRVSTALSPAFLPRQKSVRILLRRDKSYLTASDTI